MTFVHTEGHPNRVFGRVIKDGNGEVIPVESLKDCICVYVGDRGQTLFNFTVSIEGMNT